MSLSSDPIPVLSSQSAKPPYAAEEMSIFGQICAVKPKDHPSVRNGIDDKFMLRHAK